MYEVNRNAHTVLVRNPEEKKPLRRPRLVGNNMKMNIRNWLGERGLE